MIQNFEGVGDVAEELKSLEFSMKTKRYKNLERIHSFRGFILKNHDKNLREISDHVNRADGHHQSR